MSLLCQCGAGEHFGLVHFITRNALGQGASTEPDLHQDKFHIATEQVHSEHLATSNKTDGGKRAAHLEFAQAGAFGARLPAQVNREPPPYCEFPHVRVHRPASASRGQFSLYPTL